MLLGIITYFFLPSRPESTSFLTERERQIAVDRMNRDASADRGSVINKGLSTITLSYLHENTKYTSDHIIAAFCDWRVSLYEADVLRTNCLLLAERFTSVA